MMRSVLGWLATSLTSPCNWETCLFKSAIFFWVPSFKARYFFSKSCHYCSAVSLFLRMALICS